MLVEHDEWTFEVQVHTERDGRSGSRSERCRTLARERVVEWLTRNGIGASRLVARGYGSSEAAVPVQPVERTVLAQNRVELRKLNEE